jgi:glutamate-1-semialdehyde 2,1-aminomutase
MNSSARSEALFARALRVAPGGVHSPVRAFRGVGGTPRFIREAHGAYLVDVDGNTYVDFCMSWGPLLFGHQDPEVREAAVSAMSRGWSYGAAEEGSLELAEWITSRLPWVQKVRFVNSGTEAVMSALRVARGATGRRLVLKFEGCYHGHVDSMLVRAGSGLAEMVSPDSAGVSSTVAGETLVSRLDDLEQLRHWFATRGGEIAAVILEPLPANNGLLLQRDAFVRQVVNLAREHGALVIFDEVISGFRVALGGMAEKLGIRPDLVTYGKVIGGGFPVGAYGGRPELMDLVAPAGPVYQAGTLSANPVAMAAGLATLRKLESASPYTTLEESTRRFADGMEQAARSRGVNEFRVQRFGSLFWPVLGEVAGQDGIVRAVHDVPAGQKERFARLFHALLDRGVYLAPSGFEVGFFSTAHDAAALDRASSAFAAAIEVLRA